ncbi:MAG: hypothetical protein ACYCQJ_15205, partial [Nitrososphaerales archaeon]
SPLVRNIFNKDAILQRVKKSTSATIAELINNEWMNLGLQERSFKQCHGFRKMFETRMVNAGCMKDHVEQMLGHKDAYYKPDPLDTLFNAFKKYSLCMELSKNRKIESLQKELADKDSQIRDALHQLRLEFQEEIRKIVKNPRIFDT